MIRGMKECFAMGLVITLLPVRFNPNVVGFQYTAKHFENSTIFASDFMIFSFSSIVSCNILNPFVTLGVQALGYPEETADLIGCGVSGVSSGLVASHVSYLLTGYFTTNDERTYHAFEANTTELVGNATELDSEL